MTAATARNLPSRTQREICARLGISIENNSTHEDVRASIKESLKDPIMQALYQDYRDEQSALAEQELREQFGVALYEECEKWEKLCIAGQQYIAVYKKGAQIKSNVIELEAACIEGEKRYALIIYALLPKISKDRIIGSSIEWEKEMKLKPSQILELKPFHTSIDIFDVQVYEQALVIAKRLETTYMAQQGVAPAPRASA